MWLLFFVELHIEKVSVECLLIIECVIYIKYVRKNVD